MLPPFGWTAHSEQVDAASLAARVWQMKTTLVNGLTVLTTVIRAPTDPGEISRLEAIWRHRKGCKDPRCPVGVSSGLDVSLLCDDKGHFNPNVTLFATVALMGACPIQESKEFALDVKKAVENHHAAVTLVVGSLSSWASLNEDKAC